MAYRPPPADPDKTQPYRVPPPRPPAADPTASTDPLQRRWARRRDDDGWSPGAFSPAIFLVGLLIVLLLVGVTALNGREAGDPPATTEAAAGASGGQAVPAAAATATVAGGQEPPATLAAARQAPPAATAGGDQAPTAAAPSAVFVVGNTGGEGVYLRRSPRMDDRDTAYRDGTRLEQIGPDVTGDGQTWRHVRAPDGKTGYVPARYTVESR